MKSIRTTLALISLAAAGFAQAQEATPFPAQMTGAGLDRASVVAETRRALAANEIVWGNEGSEPFGRIASQRDRASVHGEAVAASRLSSADMQRNRTLYGM